MTHEEREARIKWMAVEAQRLIDARQRVPRPVNPVVVTNQHYDPQTLKADPTKVEADRVAARLVAALSLRDKANDAR